jgi:hypothetical protein
MGFAGFACLFFLSVFLVLVFLLLARSLWHGFNPTPAETAILVAFCLVALGLLVLSLRGLSCLRRRLLVARLERTPDHANDQPLLLPCCFLRSYIGPTSLSFTADAVVVCGVLGPYMLLPAVVILLLVFLLPTADVIWGKAAAAVTGGVHLLVLLGHFATNRQGYAEVAIVRPDLSAITCQGPLVTFHFRQPPFPGLSAIKIYLAPGTRREFLAQVQNRFPGFLPQEYRDALDRRDEE